MSSVECSTFWLFLNFLIFVTNVLLWFFNLKFYSELLDNVVLLFVISNLCAFLEWSFCCWINFICCWHWSNFDSWSLKFFRICVKSSSLSLMILFKRIISSLYSFNCFFISWFFNLWLKSFSSFNSSIFAKKNSISFFGRKFVVLWTPFESHVF